MGAELGRLDVVVTRARLAVYESEGDRTGDADGACDRQRRAPPPRGRQCGKSRGGQRAAQWEPGLTDAHSEAPSLREPSRDRLAPSGLGGRVACAPDEQRGQEDRIRRRERRHETSEAQPEPAGGDDAPFSVHVEEPPNRDERDQRCQAGGRDDQTGGSPRRPKSSAANAAMVATPRTT